MKKMFFLRWLLASLAWAHTAAVPAASAAMATAEVASATSTRYSGDPVDCVNPLSGCNGDAEFSRGNTVAAIVAPFGSTTWAPQTDGDASPFYQMKHTRFEGIRATHQPSIWMRDYGDFLVTPVVGPVPTRGSSTVRDRASTFDRVGDHEIARPYYYAVHLQPQNTLLELTPSERCAFLRFTFPETDQAVVVFHLEGDVTVDESSRKKRLLGKATHVTFGAPGGFGLWFVAEFDRSYEDVEFRKDGKFVTAFVHLSKTQHDHPVPLRIGTSFIDHAQATVNLQRELPNWNFGQAKNRARSAWVRELEKVQIRGATVAQKCTFFTALYRSLQFPRMFHELDAQGKQRHYSPFANGKVLDGPLYTDDGLWDTFRAAFPLFVLYDPHRSAEILEGWLNAYREGGRLPNWPSPGNRPCMIGSHSDSIFADALAKGIRSFDLQDAYAATHKNAFENDAWGWAGRDHLDEYQRLGYMPADVRKEAATSCTMEYAYDDYCVALLAQATGHEKESEELRRRSQNYRNVWDPKVGFMRGRKQDGQWQEPFDPLAWGGPFVEGNAWQWLWSVPHDPYGLKALLGGRQALADKLDMFLSMPSTTVVGGYGHKIHEMREVEFANMGQYAHVNEPDHHVLFFYLYAGQPWKTQQAVRRVMDELYNPDGMVGDEDTGEMSAWYVFNAAGLYPFCPGSPNYLIGSPLFEETVLRLQNGRTFTIRAKKNSPANRYIQSARFRGKPFTQVWIAHQTLLEGGVLEFEMGPRPNPKWGSSPGDAPPNEFPAAN